MGGAGSRGQGEGAPLRTQPPTRGGKYGGLLKISRHVCALGACPRGWGSGGRSISAQRTGASSPRHRTKKPAADRRRPPLSPEEPRARPIDSRENAGVSTQESSPRFSRLAAKLAAWGFKGAQYARRKSPPQRSEGWAGAARIKKPATADTTFSARTGVPPRPAPIFTARPLFSGVLVDFVWKFHGGTTVPPFSNLRIKKDSPGVGGKIRCPSY